MDRKRILIADDQADVLEALRFLLKAEGYQTEAVSSPAAVIHALETRDYDALIMDLNYTRDTTSGQEGLDLLGADPVDRPHNSDHRNDGVGQRRAGSRGDASWRTRLCPEAVGQRATRYRSLKRNSP